MKAPRDQRAKSAGRTKSKPTTSRSKSNDDRPAAAKAASRARQPGPPLLIVGIGASAGGLNAFKSFLSNMPADSGMAFVLIQHLSPDHKSALTEILAKATAMPVKDAAEGAEVGPNQVFVIPPNATLTIKDRILRLSTPAPPREHRRPIDTFFTALAEDQGENAVSIVLSGTGSDGAIGLSAIKEHGGLTIAQAEFDHSAMSGMPHSAVATGLVDEVLPVEDIPARLLSHQRHMRTAATRKEADGTRGDAAEHLATIARLLRVRVGHDFGQYKDKTITRRVQRRMQVLQIDTVPDYIARLRKEPRQLELLFRELLIGVTQFFRDPQAFDALETTVMPMLLDGKGAGDSVRVWVPGCATGEEVYSVAILLKEAMDRLGVRPKVQIFGTDIDEDAVATARTARYVKATGMSPERQERWFVEDGEELCPVKEIRDMCVFSVQSVSKDPPFSRLDLITCRNLLIYMNADLQDRVLRTFHYALKPNGFLFLGPSEGVTRHAKRFSALDKKYRIFQRQNGDGALPDLPIAPQPTAAAPHARATPAGSASEDRITRKARQAMEKYSPAYLVIDGNKDILRFSGGEAGRYLEPSSGAASLNLFAIVGKALRPAVRAAVQAAVASRKPVTRDSIVTQIDGAARAVNVIALPVADESDPDLCVVAFRDTGPAGGDPDSGDPGEFGHDDARALEHELRTVRAQLQSTIDELEAANEEMKSAAEEYQSVNEELQSSNEELETSKEEMQSINEELQTVNAEMNSKNEALIRVNSDIRNLLDSTEIATLFLDRELRVKGFTPPMTDIFHLRDSDRGRPITDIASLLNYTDLKRDVREVMRKLSVVEREVRLADMDMTFVLRIRPYRTIDNVIDGVVMTFVDITERQQATDQSALLLGELDHRVKNILAIVSSVISQTLKTSETPAAFAASIEGRIAAIARAHSLLTQKGGSGDVSLRDLVERELIPYDRGGRNLDISGPRVMLTPKAGLTMAMAVHELASNATKYGALSSDGGHVGVRWSVDGGADDQQLTILWTETGGPTVEEPTSRGFGTTLIERTLGFDLDGQVNREFLASGVRCNIVVPLTRDVGRLAEAGDRKSGAI